MDYRLTYLVQELSFVWTIQLLRSGDGGSLLNVSRVYLVPMVDVGRLLLLKHPLDRWWRVSLQLLLPARLHRRL